MRQLANACNSNLYAPLCVEQVLYLFAYKNQVLRFCVNLKWKTFQKSSASSTLLELANVKLNFKYLISSTYLI
jgi:hypothetical protein